MRTSWWAYIVVAVLTCSVAYRYLDQPSSPTGSVTPAEQSERYALAQNPQLPRADKDNGQIEQKPELPLTDKDEMRSDEARAEARAQDVDKAVAALQPDPLPNAQKEARREIDSVPAASEPPQLLNAQRQARLEDAAGTVTVEHSELNETRQNLSERNDTKQNLSYLAYYAYSELPPPIKPADIVLDSLKGVPSGTPVDEIKRVSAALGLDFTFMKTVAKIESGFDPKQRTGSYIGLFQLSKREFEKFGSGNILVSRDNAVAAALKFMTETILFEMFTHRKATLNDIYLIHQQGVEGAAEHVSHPHRLAWRSMCATDEGKEKGEKWCKRAIWGNTLPAVKRVWKNVNNVTSGAFIAMWQQRVSHFYGRYSEAAAN